MRPHSLPPKRWLVQPPAPPSLVQALGELSPIFLQLLYNRGLDSAGAVQSFLEGRYTASTDPFLLADMDKAVERIRQAITGDETIVVYGDFDADGVTATVLLVEALRGLGLSRQQARPYIPDRIDEGYGLNFDALTHIREELGADLVITVDCGIRSVAEAEHARAIGLDLIITDHHSLGEQLPPALAVINPKRPDSEYPEKMLAGVGIAYKLAEALQQALPQQANYELSQLLDLVALGTVADLAPLLGENRILVIEGLKTLNQLGRPGLRALAEQSGLRAGGMTAESIAFGLAPRINAAGRLAHAYDAARLLALTDLDLRQRPDSAEKLALRLNALNRERQDHTRSLTARAETLIDKDMPLIFAADSEFLPGVVGLVASRLAERYYRPTVVIEKGPAESRGSCRSIPEFHITQALDEVADLLEHYGGHAQAAGLTVRNENLPALQTQLNQIAAEALTGLNLAPRLEIDSEIELSEVDFALVEMLSQLEPTGFSNPTPVFVSRNVAVLQSRVVGSDKAHLQLDLSDGWREMKAIAFRQSAWAHEMPARIDLVYSLSINEWRGRRDLQLMVHDLNASDGQ